VVGLDALARRAALYVRFDVRGQARPSDQAARERQRLVPTEVAAQRSRVELAEHLQPQLPAGGDAQAVSARAPAVEEPVAKDEGEA
jgi:hypothetical protein